MFFDSSHMSLLMMRVKNQVLTWQNFSHIPSILDNFGHSQKKMEIFWNMVHSDNIKILLVPSILVYLNDMYFIQCTYHCFRNIVYVIIDNFVNIGKTKKTYQSILSRLYFDVITIYHFWKATVATVHYNYTYSQSKHKSRLMK